MTKSRILCIKNCVIVLISLLLLITSCQQTELEAIVSTKTTSNVKIVIDNIGSRTITPNRPNFNSFSISLTENVEENAKTISKNVTFAESTMPVEFDSVKIGLYTVSVDAFDEKNIKVAHGESVLNVQANSDNSVHVKLDYLTEGTGSFKVDISWGLFSNENPFTKALKAGNVGFVSYDVENKCNLNNAEITWLSADQIKSNGFTYIQTGVPATKGKVISFRIYTNTDENDIQCIAETFTTVIQIIPNLTSTPDLNEKDNFIITEDRVNFYVKNVNPSTIKVRYGEGAEASSKINISWKYPKLSNGDYSGTLYVYLMNQNGVQIGDKHKFDYTQDNVTGSADFTGLSTSETYSVYFYNECETGYSAVLEGLSGIKTKILVTGINFKTNIPSSLTMGSYVDIEAAVLPSNASNSSYTLSVSDGSYVSGNKTVVFNNAGKYRVTATSDENPNITITSSQIVVKLAAPIVKTSIVDEGFLIEWNEIAGATKYILTKTNNSVDNTPKIIELTTNRYIDKDTNFSGVTYYYTVQAICDDRDLDSAISAPSAIALACPSITIELPDEFTDVSLKASLDSATANSPYMTEKDSLTLNIENPDSSITEYAWYLNGHRVAIGNYDAIKSITITPDNAYLDISSIETSNTLMLTVVKDGYTYSATTYFRYIENNPGKIYISLPSGRGDTVVYNEPVQLSYTTDNLVNNIEIRWTSSDNNIASVDNGIVTAHRDGSVDITATIVATGESATISLKTFIPISEIRFDEAKQLPTEYLVAPLSSGGLEILNSAYTSVDLKNYVKVITADGTIYSVENQNWDKIKDRVEWYASESDYNNLISKVELLNGTITPIIDSLGGNATVFLKTEESDAIASKRIEIRKYTMKEGNDTINGKSIRFRSYSDHTLNLGLNGSNVTTKDSNSTFNELEIYLDWCFNGNLGEHEYGVTDLSRLKFSPYDAAETKFTLEGNGTYPTIDLYILDKSRNKVCRLSCQRLI